MYAVIIPSNKSHFVMKLTNFRHFRLYIALDHSPLQFSVFCRENINTLPVKFGNTIGLHYLSGAIFGAGWVVGSLEILGRYVNF